MGLFGRYLGDPGVQRGGWQAAGMVPWGSEYLGFAPPCPHHAPLLRNGPPQPILTSPVWGQQW